MATVVEDRATQRATSDQPGNPGPGRRSHARLYGVANGVAVVLVVAIVGFARSGGSSALPSGVAREAVEQADQSITLSQATVPAGRVGFVIKNAGTMGHELVVFRTDLPAAALPLDKDGNVNEDAPQLRNVLDTGGNIAAGHSRTIIVRLPAGHYAVICNLPGHYRLGMRADLTVR